MKMCEISKLLPTVQPVKGLFSLFFLSDRVKVNSPNHVQLQEMIDHHNWKQRMP